MKHLREPEPFAAITVVSLEHAIAAPLATRHLADLGARVLKIERPDSGDFARSYDETVQGLSSHFVWANRGKESVAVDLKSEGGRRLVERLLAEADVLVQNLAPGAAARLGLEGKQAHERHPQLICCDISGYGAEGPFAGRKAYDLLIQCEAGAVATTGTADTPSKAGIPIADIAAAMYAYSGILERLLERQVTGRGAVFEVTLLDALSEWMGYPLLYTRYGGRAPERSGARHPAIAPYGPFRTRDGTALNIAVQNDREWRRLCIEVLDSPALAGAAEFATNSARVTQRERLDSLVQEGIGRLSADEVVSRLERARIAYARMRSVAEAAEHPQLTGRGRWVSTPTPCGPVETLAPVTREAGDFVARAVPALGEHTAAVEKAFAGPRR